MSIPPPVRPPRPAPCLLPFAAPTQAGNPRPFSKSVKKPRKLAAGLLVLPCQYRSVLSGIPKPILPHPRSAEYKRARKKQIPISSVVPRRGYIPQPRVARRALPWVHRRKNTLERVRLSAQAQPRKTARPNIGMQPPGDSAAFPSPGGRAALHWAAALFRRPPPALLFAQPPLALPQ